MKRSVIPARQGSAIPANPRGAVGVVARLVRVSAVVALGVSGAVPLLGAANTGDAPLDDVLGCMKRLNEYYQSVATVDAEFSITGRSTHTVGSDVETVEIASAYHYIKSGNKIRLEEGPLSADDFEYVKVFAEGTIKTLEAAPVSFRISPDEGGWAAKACKGHRLFFPQLPAVEGWGANPEHLERLNMSIQNVTEADGRKTVEISLVLGDEDHGVRRVFRLDPALGYAPVMVSVQIRTAEMTSEFTYEVQGFLDAQNGFSAPAKVVLTSHVEQDGGIRETQETIELSKVVFNGPVDDAVFELSPEPGTHVADSIAGITYTAGQDGAQDLRASLGAEPDPGALVKTPGPSHGSVQQTLSAEPEGGQPATSAKWSVGRMAALAVLVLGLALCGCVVALRMRMHKPKE
ncbi:MAG: hypothetical protein JXR94_17650 [Candidatus Hydrogenedentes bacterium]|nr:hypothetical protein [Candidatus Hydrogenedentota bacterium]